METSNEKLRLSYSKISVFLKCRQKYHWMYNEGLYRKTKDFAPSVGIVTHHLLFLNNRQLLDKTPTSELYEFLGTEFPAATDEERQAILTEAAWLVQGYLKTLETEQVKIVSPEVRLEKDFGSYILYARFDGLAQTPDGRKWRLEYKTTGRTDSIYLKGLRRGLQTGISHLLAEHVLDDKLSGTIFSLLVKTQTPQYPWMPYPKERWTIDYAKRCADGVARQIEQNDIYPSLDCQYGSRDCDYKPLCSTNGSEAAKTAFFQRKEVKAEETSAEAKDEEQL